MYEEIAEGSDLKLPEDIELDEASQHKDIGDWGEELVKNYLEVFKCYYIRSWYQTVDGARN